MDTELLFSESIYLSAETIIAPDDSPEIITLSFDGNRSIIHYERYLNGWQPNIRVTINRVVAGSVLAKTQYREWWFEARQHAIDRARVADQEACGKEVDRIRELCKGKLASE